ncbi:putative peptidyl-prolyl isomerase cwc27 protein [Neofusicoccum parvum UCRNP2]|uniref:Putative peptidyl-prolyl isomerase cwc27 protein n=1 Tax=Botryosphaeria parva (strain UCR-NP2) TaxID=1287680 RepID=R1EFM7_BOTPV|nr:putative peptidyl-prolyl isomerase cwc27 protein [Neofusicoccum parvum UCRNP2]
MSSVYNLEPQPTAKVILHTTAGDLALELFAKQTPLASRNFLQLCLDGYYDNTIFHRLVPGFIIQGGDPTGTGSGGESSYDGEPFADEFHSRLKFNRRGLLGMANTGKKDDNGSQFFITLGQTPDLTKTNTMFGRIEGDTIYNLMKMGEADLTEEEGSERPLYPTKITGTEIIVNPFDDMVKRVQIAQPTTQEKKGPKKAKRKAAKQLLSFGGDEGDDADVAPVVKKPKFNTKLVSAAQEDGAELNNTPKPRASEPKPPKPTKKPSPQPTPSPPPKAKPAEPAPAPRRSSRSPSISSESEPEQVNKMSSLLERTNAQIAELKASMKRNTGSAAKEAPKKKSALEAMIPETSTRGRKRRGGAGDSKADLQAMELFNAFKNKLESAPKEEAPVAKAEQGKAVQEDKSKDEVEDTEAILCDLHFVPNCQSCRDWEVPDSNAANDEDNDAGWMSHALTFEKDRLGKDLEWKRKNEEELVVIDPREKAKEIVGDKKGRKHRDGDVGRDRDRDRRGGDRADRQNDRDRGGRHEKGGSWKDDRDRDNRREKIVRSMGAR